MSKIFSWEYFSFVTLDDSVLYKVRLFKITFITKKVNKECI